MQVKKAGTKILGGKLVFTRDGMLPPHVVVPRVVAARPGSHKTGISPQIPHDECNPLLAVVTHFPAIFASLSVSFSSAVELSSKFLRRLSGPPHALTSGQCVGCWSSSHGLAQLQPREKSVRGQPGSMAPFMPLGHIE
eukprot:1118569-Rhodomonas_salina.2